MLDTFCEVGVISEPNFGVSESTKPKLIFYIPHIICKPTDGDCISRSPSQHALGGRYWEIPCLFIPVRNLQSLLDLTHMCLDGGRKSKHLHKHRKNMHTRKPPAKLIP